MVVPLMKRFMTALCFILPLRLLTTLLRLLVGKLAIFTQVTTPFTLYFPLWIAKLVGILLLFIKHTSSDLII